MEGARETSPESTTSGGDGFVYVSGVEIAGAEGSGTDPVAERGISGGGARGEHAILPEEAVGDGFDEEFEDSEVGLEEMMEEPKRVLPEELAKGVVVLECESSAEGGSCDVYLVGTAHVSQVALLLRTSVFPWVAKLVVYHGYKINSLLITREGYLSLIVLAASDCICKMY